MCLPAVQALDGHRLLSLCGSVSGFFQIRPYTPESTGSRPISEVKLVMAQSVLWWGTTREYCVLYLLFFFSGPIQYLSNFLPAVGIPGMFTERAVKCFARHTLWHVGSQHLYAPKAGEVNGMNTYLLGRVESGAVADFTTHNHPWVCSIL